jgi:hypothetical protein
MIQSDTVRNIINFVLFQVGWFACVLYPGLAAVGVVVVILAVHMVFISKARMSELQFIGAGIVLGVFWTDSGSTSGCWITA